ncbi:hypothetical protein SAMN05216389_101323 [Oceanobacillus limi]|uniref:Uncharacterized protein n=1 Tax=Oceanobacillus limi TaxID=930131 RepID=A0A1H9YCW1_9BACI|nr:hypothetical protein [Oceanobacillus limi]SES66795.1 hypothetical protein SAMN05216389_101323 [Oceanobacillus limi]
MEYKSYLKINVKILVYHFCLVVLGTGIIGVNWNGPVINETMLLTFIVMLFLHFVVGFLLRNNHSWFVNAISVSFVLIINLVMYFYSLLFSSELPSLVNVLVIIFKFPFLYILGWQDINYPLLAAVLPCLFLWLGLETRSIVHRLSKRKESNSRNSK